METKQEKRINIHGLDFGADPEIFLKDKDTGNVIGSEKIIPHEGIKYYPQDRVAYIIRDGIQAEFNVVPNSCRQLFSVSLASNLYLLLSYIRKNNHNVDLDWRVNVPITEEEMDSLSFESKQFGCVPSYNIYEPSATVGVEDASKYMFRSAGGHIHLGGWDKKSTSILQDFKRMVPLLDLIVGNSCVLIDRDTGNADRRKTYGRAGEYRKPKYGIEYRTLSNFWLRGYILASLVTGLARQAYSILYESTPENDYASEFMSKVDIKDVRNAINNNDFDLAMSNYLKIKPLFEKYFQLDNSSPFTLGRMEEFEHFVKQGINHWLSGDLLVDWNTSTGIERLFDNRVRMELDAEEIT